MSHPAIPDNQNPPEDPSGTPPSSPDSGNEPAPNPSNPPASVTESENVTRYNELLEQNLRDQNRRIQELQDELARSRQTPASPPPAPRSEEEERQDFYNRPVATTRQMIQEELDRTIRPLTEFVNQMRGGTESERILARLKVDPRFAPHWDGAVEAAVNSVIQRLTPDQINETTITSTVIQAIGLKSIGQLAPVPSSAPAPSPAPTPTPSTPAGNPPVVTPPHMRPSSPPGPSANQRPARRQLNENEKRLAREKRMTDDQYLDWLEMPASAIGKAPIPGAPAAK